MAVIGRPDLGEDASLATNDGRVARVAELDAAIAHWTTGQTAAAALTELDGAEVPAGRILSVADIVADPHYQARDMLPTMTLDDGTPVRMPGIVPQALPDTGRDPLGRSRAGRA